MHLILTEPTRIDKLKGWLRMNRISQRQLARCMGMSQTKLNSLVVNSNHATEKRVEQLRTLGVPEELLPAVRERRPRHKPQKENAAL